MNRSSEKVVLFSQLRHSEMFQDILSEQKLPTKISVNFGYMVSNLYFDYDWLLFL